FPVCGADATLTVVVSHHVPFPWMLVCQTRPDFGRTSIQSDLSAGTERLFLENGSPSLGALSKRISRGSTEFSYRLTYPANESPIVSPPRIIQLAPKTKPAPSSTSITITEAVRKTSSAEPEGGSFRKSSHKTIANVLGVSTSINNPLTTSGQDCRHNLDF